MLFACNFFSPDNKHGRSNTGMYMQARHKDDFSPDIKLTSGAYDGFFTAEKVLNTGEYAIDRVLLVWR